MTKWPACSRRIHGLATRYLQVRSNVRVPTMSQQGLKNATGCNVLTMGFKLFRLFPNISVTISLAFAPWRYQSPTVRQQSWRIARFRAGANAR